MKPAARVHYLPGNKAVWSPPTVIFLTTTTTVVAHSDPERLVLTGWIARVVKRKDVRPGSWVERTGQGATPRALAEWITEQSKGRETVWLFTHNAALDLITTQLPLALHHYEWDVTAASLASKAPWIRMVRGSHRLCVADSFSWLPHTATDLAERIGVASIQRDIEESSAEWSTRSARHDLTVVSDAMLTLMDWWDKHALGKWSVSGPSTGWHAMRHLPSPWRVVIDPRPERIAADREAIYGGRRGAWMVGTRSLGPFLELDFANAYPSVACGLPLPSRRTASFQSLALDDWRLDHERWGVIAEVHLKTNRPRWPVRFPGGTFCPTGEFRTTLCGPEIRDALRLGALVGIGPGITHQLNYHLRPWGNWVLDVTHNRDGDTPVAAQVAAKAWSRSVIGKWSSRAYERIDLGPAEHRGWSIEEGWNHDTQTRMSLISLAGQRWTAQTAGDAEQAYPAVFAWVESETRVRLTRVIEAIGEGAVLQCDTDGLIVAERLLGTRAAKGHLRAPERLTGAARTKWVMDQLDPIIAPLTIRVKKTHQSVRILGPQHVHTPGDRKFSGLPKLAKEEAPNVYKYKQWPGLSYQLGHGAERGYVRPEATVRIVGPYAPGWVLSDGRVIPPECRIRPDGSNRILGWHEMTTKPKGAKRADKQHPVLEALW